MGVIVLHQNKFVMPWLKKILHGVLGNFWTATAVAGGSIDNILERLGLSSYYPFSLWWQHLICPSHIKLLIKLLWRFFFNFFLMICDFIFWYEIIMHFYVCVYFCSRRCLPTPSVPLFYDFMVNLNKDSLNTKSNLNHLWLPKTWF